MRVLLSVYGSRGDVQPLLGLGVALQNLGAEVQCAPSDDDFAELFARVGVPVVPDRHRTVSSPSGSEALIEPLTDGESRVLRYLSTNLSKREIAQELYVSVQTIKTHMKHISAKLDAHNRLEAVQRAHGYGLIGRA